MARLFFVITLLLSLGAHAAPGSFTYEGYLTKTDGTYFSETAAVQFKIFGYSNGSECLLYSETHPSVDVSGGHFSLRVGAVSGSFPAGVSRMERIFDDSAPLSGIASECPSAFQPAATDAKRFLRISVVTLSLGPATLGDVELTSAPHALVANQVGGSKERNLLRVTSEVDPLTAVQYTALVGLSNNTSSLLTTSSSVVGAQVSGDITGNAMGFTGSLAGDVTGGQSSNVVGKIQGHPVAAMTPTNGQVLKWSSTNNRWEPSTNPGGGTVTEVIGGDGVTVTDSTLNPTINLRLGTSAQKGILQLAMTGESSSSKAVAANDTRLSDARTPLAHVHSISDIPGVGTVTSVGLSTPAYMSVSGSPVTTAGTLSLGFQSQSSGKVFASPISANGAPSFRSLQISDVQSSVIGSFIDSSAVCSAGQQLSYSSVSDKITCVSIALTSGNVTAGLGFTPVNKAGDTMTGVLNLASNGLNVGSGQFAVASGNVGIGTSAPTSPLSLNAASSDMAVFSSSSNYAALRFAQNGATLGTIGYGGLSHYFGGTTAIADSMIIKGQNAVQVGVGSTATMTVVSNKVGIGTNAPASALDVSGQIVSRSANAGSTASIDLGLGNTIISSADCSSALSFANMRDGGSYTVIVTSTGTAQCNFSTTAAGADAATVTYRFNPPNAPRLASSHTLYSLTRAGTTVYVSWISGF